MKRVLINEPHEAVRGMLTRMLTRLGYEPIAVQVPAAEQLLHATALLIEPAAPAGVLLAQATRIAAPELPLVCASVIVPDPELANLGIEFDAQLVKFTSDQLDLAIQRACARRASVRPPGPGDSGLDRRVA
jgi:hypothetical protein